MRKGITYLTLLTALTLAACTESKSVDYYLENPDERQRDLIKCLVSDVDETSCKNAEKAHTKQNEINKEREKEALNQYFENNNKK